MVLIGVIICKRKRVCGGIQVPKIGNKHTTLVKIWEGVENWPCQPTHCSVSTGRGVTTITGLVHAVRQKMWNFGIHTEAIPIPQIQWMLQVTGILAPKDCGTPVNQVERTRVLVSLHNRRSVCRSKQTNDGMIKFAVMETASIVMYHTAVKYVEVAPVYDGNLVGHAQPHKIQYAKDVLTLYVRLERTQIIVGVVHVLPVWQAARTNQKLDLYHAQRARRQPVMPGTVVLSAPPPATSRAHRVLTRVVLDTLQPRPGGVTVTPARPELIKHKLVMGCAPHASQVNIRIQQGHPIA